VVLMVFQLTKYGIGLTIEITVSLALLNPFLRKQYCHLTI